MKRKKRAFRRQNITTSLIFRALGTKLYILFFVEELVLSLERVVTWENSLVVFHCQF